MYGLYKLCVHITPYWFIKAVLVYNFYTEKAKSAEVVAFSGLRLRKWRALARPESRASAPAKAAEVGDLPDPYFPPEFSELGASSRQTSVCYLVDQTADS